MSSSSRTFNIGRTFNPQYSVLGKLIRKRVAGEWKAGSYYILTFIGLILLAVVGQQLAWAFVEETITSNPLGPTAVVFWFSQVAAFGLLIVGALVGFSDEISIEVHRDNLLIRRNNEIALELGLNNSVVVELIEPVQFHRQIRRAEGVHVFANKVTDPVLLLTTDDVRLALGLIPEDRERLLASIEHLDQVHNATDSNAATRSTAAVA